MAIHPNFPLSPHEILSPDVRWFPADELLRETSFEKLLPPLVHELRRRVFDWRNRNYEGVSATTKSLLTWWFETSHPMPQADGTISNFQYYLVSNSKIFACLRGSLPGLESSFMISFKVGKPTSSEM